MDGVGGERLDNPAEAEKRVTRFWVLRQQHAHGMMEIKARPADRLVEDLYLNAGNGAGYTDSKLRAVGD
jgi:hypothetical protein